MRISHKHKFIFVSKWKCASESIREFFGPFSDIKSCQSYPYYHHTTAMELKKHFRNMGWNWAEYFSFISIRNPWEMLVSLYCYGLPDTDGNYYWNRHWQEIKEGIYYPEQRLVPLNPIGFEKWVKTYDMEQFTLDYFTKDENRENIVTDIIKVENINEDVQRIVDIIGIKRNISELRIRNRSCSKNVSEFYNDELNEIVCNIFSSDIKRGGYQPPTSEMIVSDNNHFYELTNRDLVLLFRNEREYLLKR